MASYNIIDTGYANTTQTGTQETRANSGTAISLNVESINWTRGVGYSDSPNPGRFANTQVNKASVSNPVLVLRGLLDRADANYESNIDDLDTLCITKGLKLLYYSSTTDGFKPITSAKGSATFGSLQVDGTTKALLVEVLGFDMSEQKNSATKGLQRYTLTLEVTNPNN